MVYSRIAIKSKLTFSFSPRILGGDFQVLCFYSESVYYCLEKQKNRADTYILPQEICERIKAETLFLFLSDLKP